MAKYIVIMALITSSLSTSLVGAKLFSMEKEVGKEVISGFSAKALAQGIVIPQDSNDTVAFEDSVRERPTANFVEEYENGSSLVVWATGYSSEPEQTDDTPFITASGSTVRDGVAAANFLPMGTRFRVPEIYKNKIFTVEDRMNSRFGNQQIVDIWFEDTNDAHEFGRKIVAIELL
ncbi:MAG: hypothetical protein WC705_02370 [Candidatus Paceibacterota bacterium]|jgi:3D (Asp-Asp-Asp) domain-containing protein